jgi:hypothetical protein
MPPKYTRPYRSNRAREADADADAKRDLVALAETAAALT